MLDYRNVLADFGENPRFHSRRFLFVLCACPVNNTTIDGVLIFVDVGGMLLSNAGWLSVQVLIGMEIGCCLITSCLMMAGSISRYLLRQGSFPPYTSRSKVLTLIEVGPDRVFKMLPLVMIGIISSWSTIQFGGPCLVGSSIMMRGPASVFFSPDLTEWCGRFGTAADVSGVTLLAVI